jgi:hypothetical protein
MTFADQILSFYKSLNLSVRLPEGIDVMNPLQNREAYALCEKFYHRFYDDQQHRKIILGINPGRFGGGITGIPFTDPVKLETFCDIPNKLSKKTELSADFIYKMIEGFGGAKQFYGSFFISAVSPLGFTHNGVNLNYYDNKELETLIRPFILDSIRAQLKFPIDRDICFCLGEGQNYKYLLKLNKEYSFFEKIIALPHPRFIMQYRRKKITDFVNIYIQKLNQS